MAAKKTAKKAATKAAKKSVAKAKSAKKDAQTKVAKKPVKKATKKAAKKVASVKKAAKKPRSAKAVTKTAAPAKKAPARKTSTRSALQKAAARVAAKKAAAQDSMKPTVSSEPAPKKPKCPLTRSELNQFRKLLVEKRRSLIGDMNGMEGNSLGRNMQDSSGDLSNMPTHPADIGSDNFEHEFTLGLLESERELLEEINNALERIETKWYGICLGTGAPIPKARLKIKPWCKYGIDYQRKIEKGLVRAGEDDLFGD